MTPTNNIPQKRIFELDILRGAAISLVCLRHTIQKSAGILDPIIQPLQQLGWTGVDLFFVLSGFLIGNLLFKEFLKTSTLDIGRFIVRRGFKIWPAYYFFMAIATVISVLILGDIPKTCSSLLRNLFFIQNYIPPYSGLYITGQTWSLCVEEHFYLILPCVLLLLSKANFGKRKFIFPLLSLIMAMTCLGFRTFDAFQHDSFIGYQIAFTHFRLDSLFCGVFLAYLFNYRPDQWASIGSHKNKLLVIGLLLISPMCFVESSAGTWQMRFVCTIGLTMLYAGYGCLLVYMLNLSADIKKRIADNKLLRFLAFIGFYSYSIYLWHHCAAVIALACSNWISQAFGLGPIWSLKFGPLPDALIWLIANSFYLAISICIGYLAARLIEQPALAIRDKLFPSILSTRTQIATDMSEFSPNLIQKSKHRLPFRTTLSLLAKKLFKKD